jgi:hypothetical protein
MSRASKFARDLEGTFMKCKSSFLVVAFLLGSCSLALAQAEAPRTPIRILPRTPTRILHNSDILRMHEAGVKPGEIIAKILVSECHFDIFPPVLRDFEMRGIPDTVLMAMTMVPYGPPNATAVKTSESQPQTARVEIPEGTLVELEVVSPVSSADVGEGSGMTFLVTRRVVVKGVLVIARGAVARARVINSKRAGSWGRGGMLDWVMQDVVAVDGTRVPILLSGQVKGTNRSAAVVAAAIVTGAIVFPYSPPAGLIWALKKGGEAVLDESRKSTATVGNKTEVAGMLPEKQKVIYHSVEKLKATTPANAPGLPAFNDSFRATPIRRH